MNVETKRREEKKKGREKEREEREGKGRKKEKRGGREEGRLMLEVEVVVIYLDGIGSKSLGKIVVEGTGFPRTREVD